MPSHLALLLALACSGETTTRDSATTGDTGTPLGDSGTTGDTADTGDTPGAPPATPAEVSAEVSPHVGTVVRVTWTTAGAGTSRVVWDGGETAAADNGAGTHQALVVGLDPEAELSLWVVSEHGGETVESDPVMVTTGALHPDLPSLSVAVHSEDAGGGWILGSTKNGNPAALVLDRTGRIVWWHVGDTLYGHLVPTDEGLLYLGAHPDGRALNLISWWGDERESQVLPDAHHAFGVQADGTVAFIATDKRPWSDFDSVAGDAVRHLADDGAITDIWNVWDVLEPVWDQNWDSPYYSDAEDWTHANGLDVDPTDDTALLTLTNIDALALIDLQTGALLEGSEVLGGTWRTAEGEAFDFPHDVHRLDDSTLLLTTNVDSETRAAEYTLADGVWSRGWTYGSGQPANVGGAASRLDSGHTLIGWGRGSKVEEVTRDGEAVWVAEFLRDPALGTFSSVDAGPWGAVSP